LANRAQKHQPVKGDCYSATPKGGPGLSGIFITGTDTEVGKTYFTLLLARFLANEGIDVGIMKPISCGPQQDNDAIKLKTELRIKDPIALINPVQLKYPLSPFTNTKLLKKKINLLKIFKAYKILSKLHELVLVEGVGGALTPILNDYFVADLIKDLKLPTIIVSRAGLGTLNHTLMTIEALKARKINILGIILNGFKGKERSEKTNADDLASISSIPILAKIKWQKN
jgi:dethiobiotin synthetase